MSIRVLLRSSRSLYTCMCVPHRENVGRYPCTKTSPVSKSFLQFYSSAVPPRDDNREQIEEDSEEEHVYRDYDPYPVKENQRLFPTFDTHSQLIADGVRYDELPIIHVRSTHNNTLVVIFKGGKTVSHSSGGLVGFRNKNKGTTVAAQAVALDIAQKSKRNDITSVRVSLKGIGPGRLPFLRSLALLGINIVSVTDVTHIPLNGNTPKNKRIR